MSEKKQAPKTAKIIAGIIVGLFALFILIGITSEDTPTQTNSAETSDVEAKEEDNVVKGVEAALAELDDETKQSLASTSAGGFQGDIEKVEAYGDDGVKIHVSTHYTESGSEANGGQNIARKIMATICYDIPELSSVYVTSTSSGLDSRSVYRSDIPACKS